MRRPRETRPELHQAFVDLRSVDCDILTVGPVPASLGGTPAVERYYHPDEFVEMREEALALGFKHVESGPLVRSSYHARDQVPGAEARRAARGMRAGEVVGATDATGAAEAGHATWAGDGGEGAVRPRPDDRPRRRVIYQPD